MKRRNLISKTAICLYLVLTCVIGVGCDSDKDRRDKLGTKSNIMTDQNGNRWLVKHNFGDNYTIEYLTDSVDWNAHNNRINAPISQ